MRTLEQGAAALTSLAVLAFALAGCATPPPQAAPRKAAILVVPDDSARADKSSRAALESHPQWLPRDGELTRAALDTITQRLTHARPSWQVVQANDADLAAFVAMHPDDGEMFADAFGAPRREVGELLQQLDIDAVFVLTERTLRKLPSRLPGQADDADVVAYEQVAIELFDRTRAPGKEADHSSLTVPIVDPPTPEARATLLKDPGTTRRDLVDLLRRQGY